MAEFLFPEFNDKQRIKNNTKRYKNVTIEEAFSDAFEVKLFNSTKQLSDNTIGSIITIETQKITNNNIIFESYGIKEEIELKTNIFSEELVNNINDGKHFSIYAKIIGNKNNKLTIDPFSPYIEQFNNNYIDSSKPSFVRVKINKLIRGGFIGETEIDSLSLITGKKQLVNVFIPGSQISLNIEDNFEQWIGKEVECFLTVGKSNNNSNTYIGSHKKYLQYIGNSFLIESYIKQNYKDNIYNGRITGVLNSSNKCGVFVEIPELNITGMVSMKSDKLVNFKKGNEIEVKIKNIESDKSTKFEISEDGYIKVCNLKPIFVITK